MFELTFFYVSVLIINFISTCLRYVCLFYYIFFYGDFVRVWVVKTIFLKATPETRACACLRPPLNNGHTYALSIVYTSKFPIINISGKIKILKTNTLK